MWPRLLIKGKWELLTQHETQHLSMSSPTTPRAGHIGGYVGICTSSLWNPHPLGAFRIDNPRLTNKRSLLFWKRMSLYFVFVMQKVLPWKLTALFWLPYEVWRCTSNTVFLTSILNNHDLYVCVLARRFMEYADYKSCTPSGSSLAKFPYKSPYITRTGGSGMIGALFSW